jgi:CheY-like chemotaxis protein
LSSTCFSVFQHPCVWFENPFISIAHAEIAHLGFVNYSSRNFHTNKNRLNSFSSISLDRQSLPEWCMKILLVEDDDMNRDMLSRRLRMQGFDVVEAVNGLEGVAAAVEKTPDLILMDMSLPELDGWAATRRLKADPTTEAIPVIALTAHAMSTDRQKALEAGCDEYDTKPIELTRLLGKIRALVPGVPSP